MTSEADEKNMADQRAAIIELSRADKSNVTIADDININRQTMRKVVKSSQENNDAEYRPMSSKPRTQRTQAKISAVRERIRSYCKRSRRLLANESKMSPITIRDLIHKDLKKPIGTQDLSHRPLEANGVR